MNVSHPPESLVMADPPRGMSYWWMTGIMLVVWYIYSIESRRRRGIKAPWVGFRLWEPDFMAAHHFFRHAPSLIDEGYRKYKDSMFQIRRTDADMVVVSNRYIDELRRLPAAISSPTIAHAHNLLAPYTSTDIILGSNLHFRLLQTKLTPQLGNTIRPMLEELNYAMDVDFPRCKHDWVSLEPYHVILRIVSRISARVFVGYPFCRSEEWLEISTQYTENVFVTVVIMRLFPPWMHRLVSFCLPARWRLASYIRRAKRALVPEIKRRQAEQAVTKGTPEHPDDILQCMMDCANEWEKKPERLAQLEVVLSLASIHTTQMAVVHALYDLCVHPEYLEPLREEMRQVIEEEGGLLTKGNVHKLRKLDSFMKESQRFNPPSQLAFHRVLLQDVVLSDGTHLPKGTHLSMASRAIQNDEQSTPEPEKFDGLRYYRLRLDPDQSHRHQFATTEDTILHFGHGTYACPGRFFASLEIKLVMVRLLMDYDFKLPDGSGRPPNLTAHEYIFPNPAARMLFKERTKTGMKNASTQS
ncbi:MAG: hypothetical protein M1823_006198 [Watsoniomyces obsoletus]|nr:MAG: hypothetical protein M1823_006198 [Watsoniomyces obsoletus]